MLSGCYTVRLCNEIKGALIWSVNWQKNVRGNNRNCCGWKDFKWKCGY